MLKQDDIYDLRILICDDSITNVLLLSRLLESEGFSNVTTVTDPREVLPLLERKPFDLLLLDIVMPHLDGFQVMKQISESFVSRRLMPIMVLTGQQGIEVRNQALQQGAQDFLNKPFDQSEVVLRVENILRVRQAYLMQLDLSRKLEYKVNERTRELDKATDILIQRLARAAELRDKKTGEHVFRVGQYARVLAEAYGLPADLCFMIERAAPLHDVGKIGVPDNILLKPGPLTQEERLRMNEHVDFGVELLTGHESVLIKMASSIALTHHESWDGRGYPSRLKGEAIPIEGRITAIADVFDALVSERPYKKAWTVADAAEYINQKSGLQFDPILVQLFNECLEKIYLIRFPNGVE